MSDIFSSVSSSVLTSFWHGFSGALFFGTVMYIATKCNKVEKFNALRLYDILAVAIIGGSTVSSVFGILGHKEMRSLDVTFWTLCWPVGIGIHVIGEKVNEFIYEKK